jgi:ketosteroid isomerase-like protein
VTDRGDPLELVKRSPAAVARHDKEAWLALFTEDATIQDPVGAATYGRDRFPAFWDVFIAPNRVEFIPKRDFVRADLVVRHVTISVTTEIDDRPLLVPAILEYRVNGGRIASLRAFWESSRSVKWYLSRGLSGARALLGHGARMTAKLGVGTSIALSRGMSPAIPRETGAKLIEELARQIREDQLPDLPRDGRRLGIHPEEVIVAGDHVAAVLSSSDRVLAAAAIGRVSSERIAELALIWG